MLNIFYNLVLQGYYFIKF